MNIKLAERHILLCCNQVIFLWRSQNTWYKCFKCFNTCASTMLIMSSKLFFRTKQRRLETMFQTKRNIFSAFVEYTFVFIKYLYLAIKRISISQWCSEQVRWSDEGCSRSNLLPRFCEYRESFRIQRWR